MPSDTPRFSGPLERQLLAQLLIETRRRASLDVTGAAQRWSQPVARLQAIEAGDVIPDWHEIHHLLAAYERGFLPFVVEFEERLAALVASADPVAFLPDPDALR